MLTPTESTAVQILPDGRLNTKNAARYVGLSTKTLATMRCKGTGPKFVKRGRVFYFQDDLDGYINAGGRVVSTAQGRANARRVSSLEGSAGQVC